MLSNFLVTLPALLGLTGFVVYQLIVHNGSGDRITREIVAKLRNRHAGDLPKRGEGLTPADLARAIGRNARLMADVDKQDFELLREALRRQQTTSLVVYLLCGFL